MAKTVRLGILLSGSGRTLENILTEIDGGRLAGLAEVVVVIASRPEIRGIEIGEKAGVPVHLVRRKGFENVGAYSEAMVAILDEAEVDLVCLAGFLSYWILPDRYLGRVMNIHPALLPSFPGLHAQRQALEHGVKISGCTVHIADEGIDTGPILMQRAVPVLDDDTEDSLSARILEQEHDVYWRALAYMLDRFSDRGIAN